MSERYRWERYAVVLSADGTSETVTYSPINTTYAYRGSGFPAVKFNAQGIYYSTENGGWTKLTSNGLTNSYPVTNNARYILCTSKDYMALYECPDSDYADRVYWRVGSAVQLVYNPVSGGTAEARSFTKYTPTAEKGNLQDAFTTAKQNAYAPGANSDGYYYEYLGADNIDPAAVSLSREGQNVTAAVTPRPNAFGNTVFYQYYYSTNGGSSWTAAGSKTTETSQVIAIPSGAAQIRVRVQASDDTGFTSADYVASANLSLNSAPAGPGSVTIPGTVKPGESFPVSWSASADPDGNLSGYEVQRAYDGGSSWTTVSSDTAGTSVTDAVEKGHTSVQYRVRAKDADGLTSAWTCSNTASIYIDQAPTAPSSVTIPGTVYPGRSFTVRWGASTDPDGDLSAYEVQRAYNGGSSWAGVAASVQGTSLTAAVGRGYASVRYRVRARDAGGLTSAWTYSNTGKVQNIGAYVGVGDKARRAAKLYVGVDGKARRVLRGYVGVNGKARLFLDVPIDKTGKDVIGTARTGSSKIWKGAD